MVEADEGPVRGQLVRLERTPRRVADHKRDAGAAQQLVDVLDEPALVPEFEAVAAGRERVQRLSEPLVLAAKRLRQLPEDRPELG